MSANQPPDKNPESFDAGPVNPDIISRPEQGFVRRRQILVLVIATSIIAFCLWEVQGLMNPTKGMSDFLVDFAKQTQVALASKTPGFSLGLTSTVTIATPVPTIAVQIFPASMSCRANVDVVAPGFTIPSRSLVFVTGFSYAQGGMVFVAEPPGAGWLPGFYFSCPSDVVKLERPYSMTVSSVLTPTVLSAVKQVVQVRTVVVPGTPLPTYTPYPTQTPAMVGPMAINGLWFDSSNCIHLDIFNVNGIWVNGSPATGGSVMCNAQTVLVKIK